MKSKINSNVVIIIVLGLIIAILSYQFLTSGKTNIYLFTDDFPAGTEITGDTLISQEISGSIVENVSLNNGDLGYVTENNLENYIGSYLTTDVIKGTAFMKAYSDEVGGTPAEVRLEPNNVAVTVPVDNITGVNPFINNGARVNVYATVQYQNEQTITYTLLQNVRVIDVLYAEIYNEMTESPTIMGVTIETTPQQAVELQFACENGAIRLGIVKPGNYKETEKLTHTDQTVKVPDLADGSE